MIAILLSNVYVLDQILNAGNAITAFSLLLYALTFNLRERAARTLALLLGCVTLVYFSDVLTFTAGLETEVGIWLRLQLVGISLVPAAYVHISDALLESTGRPSRGRRHLVIRLSYFMGGAAIGLIGFTDLVGGAPVLLETVSYLQPGPLFPVFIAFYLVALGFSGVNFWRAYKRCLTRVSRRRMGYLMAGSMGPALATFPFLMVGGRALLTIPLVFWSVLIAVNVLVACQIVLMTYAVAYFGVSYPDRIVKGRLFQWILRGPVVASTVLAVSVVVNRVSQLMGMQNSRAVPFSMVATLLLLQYVITLVRPTIERWLFYGVDRNDVLRLHLLEERLLTTGDLRQYLESILNAACDVTGAPSAFVAVVGGEGLELEVTVGQHNPLRGSEELKPILPDHPGRPLEGVGVALKWDAFWIISLRSSETSEMVGILGLRDEEDEIEFDDEVTARLGLLVERASVALADRLLQREIFAVMDRLVPQVEAVQRMRAAARFGGTEALTSPLEGLPTDADVVNLVRQALGHYWGGPRLTSSPLLGLRVVRETIDEYKGNPVHALRAILRQAIDHVRPEGERRFTAEWMLYNILEMKFLEGRKVRDIAMRLAMSEADLYRKQRVAIEAVATAIMEMEKEALARSNSGSANGV